MVLEHSGFYFGQVNSNSVRNKIDEITRILSNLSDKPTVLAINDTRLTSKCKLSFKGYRVFRADHPSDRKIAGGAALIVSDDLKVSKMQKFETLKESLGIEITQINGRKLRISTAYIHPRERVMREHFSKLMENSNEVDFALFIGDFNGKVGLLEREGIDEQGAKLLDLSNEFNMTLANEANCPTYVSTSRDTTSAIDLAFYKSKLRREIVWRTLESIGSDHVPTLLEIKGASSADQI